MVERVPDKNEVLGSIPSAPTRGNHSSEVVATLVKQAISGAVLPPIQVRPPNMTDNTSENSSIHTLTDYPLAEFNHKQIKQFTKEKLQTQESITLNFEDIQQFLTSQRSTTVMAVDVGGNKIDASLHTIGNGRIERQYIEHAPQGESNGDNYLHFLERVAQSAQEKNIPVGISFAGPVTGSKPDSGPNVSTFIKEFHKKYGGDFKNLFPTYKMVTNDAVAGLIAGAVEAKQRYRSSKRILYIINGSGIGGAVLKGRQLFAIEPGHVPLIDELNGYHQTKQCDVFGATFTCIEAVAGGKAGVEDLWAKQTGAVLNGEQINMRFESGDVLASQLYAYSADIVAHAIVGIAHTFDLISETDFIIVGHGGIFNVKGYGERIRKSLEQYLEFSPQMLFTKDFSENACLDGASLSAL